MRLPLTLASSFLLALAIVFTGPQASCAQEDAARIREAYFRAVGEHFGVPFQEVTIIGEWDLTADEVPVVLFLARRAGVTPDALIGSRRGGRPWREVAGRFGVDPGAFHLSLPLDADLGHLARCYSEFRGRPSSQWSRIQLEDGEIVSLVNIRVLSEQTGAPPTRVLRVREGAGSFLASYPLLIRR